MNIDSATALAIFIIMLIGVILLNIWSYKHRKAMTPQERKIDNEETEQDRLMPW